MNNSSEFLIEGLHRIVNFAQNNDNIRKREADKIEGLADACIDVWHDLYFEEQQEAQNTETKWEKQAKEAWRRIEIYKDEATRYRDEYHKLLDNSLNKTNNMEQQTPLLKYSSKWVEFTENCEMPELDTPVLILLEDGNMFVDMLDKDGHPLIEPLKTKIYNKQVPAPTHWCYPPEPPIKPMLNTGNEEFDSWLGSMEGVEPIVGNLGFKLKVGGKKCIAQVQKLHYTEPIYDVKIKPLNPQDDIGEGPGNYVYKKFRQ